MIKIHCTKCAINKRILKYCDTYQNLILFHTNLDHLHFKGSRKCPSNGHDSKWKRFRSRFCQLINLNCKVEFNQPFYWLYSVLNLLVFQHLVTLYLGGFVVRVVSEIECWLLKSVQENRDSRLVLAGDSRLQAARRSTRAKRARRWIVMLAGALQDKTRQLAIRLSHDLVKLWGQAASHPCFVKPDVSHSSLTPV